MQGRHIREQSYMHDEPARPVRTKFCTHISSHCVRELRVPCAKHTHTVRDKPCTQINDPQLQALQLIKNHPLPAQQHVLLRDARG